MQIHGIYLEEDAYCRIFINMEAESPTRRVGREVEDLSCLTIHQDMGRFRKEAITNLFFLAREEEFPDLIVTGNDITYQLYPESKSMDRYIASINSSHTFLDKLIDILLNILKSLSLVHSRNACLLDLDINHIFILLFKLCFIHFCSLKMGTLNRGMCLLADGFL